MKSLKQNLIPLLVIISLLVIVTTIYLNQASIREFLTASIMQLNIDSPLEDFAQCLREKGVKFYGASWDGHTQNQKAMFGKTVESLPFIECMKEEKEEMSPECQEAEIKAFPTWEFPDGKKIIGETFLKNLSELSGCRLER